MKKKNRTIIEKSVTKILKALGEDPTREGLLETPQRVARALAELTEGYTDETDLGKIFKVDKESLVSVLDIPFKSLCEHHMLPFNGLMDIEYQPRFDTDSQKYEVIGISKIPRLVKKHMRRLTLQEKLCGDIADELQKITNADYVKVTAVGEHMCMTMRGAKSSGKTKTICTAYSSEYKESLTSKK